MTKAVLATLQLPHQSAQEVEDNLTELVQLAEDAGLTVVAKVVQNRPRVVPATYIGLGKIMEIKELLSDDEHIVIFDDELTPAQQGNLSELLDAPVLDRTQLILDIFARRARTKEGKIQVELAQLKYLLPRLTGHGTALSRLGGGIGTRGPGETKLETDREGFASALILKMNWSWCARCANYRWLAEKRPMCLWLRWLVIRMRANLRCFRL